MRLRDLLRPRQIAYLGPRTLAVFLGVGALGLVLYSVGVLTSSTTLRGAGVLFIFMSVVYTIGLLLRWLILRKIG